MTYLQDLLTKLKQQNETVNTHLSEKSRDPVDLSGLIQTLTDLLNFQEWPPATKALLQTALDIAQAQAASNANSGNQTIAQNQNPINTLTNAITSTIGANQQSGLFNLNVQVNANEQSNDVNNIQIAQNEIRQEITQLQVAIAGIKLLLKKKCGKEYCHYFKDA